MTIYLFCVGFQEKTKLKSLYKYILNHWQSRFPALPPYETFVNLLNRISSVFPGLVASLIEDLDTVVSDLPIVLTDSLPIITCSAKRKARIARDIDDKGFFNKQKRQLRFYT